MIGTGACACLILGMVFGPVSARASSVKPERVRILGHEYVNLEDWARGHGFSVKGPTGNKELEVTSRWTRMRFTVDSREAEINGVRVWLSLAIAAGKGAAYIGWIDLQTVVHPILYPRRAELERRIRRICLDPGHGGHDPGNQAGRHQEKRYTLLLARELEKLLRRQGFEVVLTRNRDDYISLPTRSGIANTRKADLLISLHYNSVHRNSPPVRGVEVFCLTPPGAHSTNARGQGDTSWVKGNKNDAANVLLAYHLQRSLLKNLAMEDRGLRRARFAVLRTPEMPSVLVEAGFMSDPSEASKIYNASHRRKTAEAILQGILSYKRAVEAQK